MAPHDAIGGLESRQLLRTLLSVSYTHLAGFYGILSACNAAVHYADKVEGLSETRINELVSEDVYKRQTKVRSLSTGLTNH